MGEFGANQRPGTSHNVVDFAGVANRANSLYGRAAFATGAPACLTIFKDEHP
jgi:hypothetical protein